MCRVRCTLTSHSRKAVERQLKTAQHQGRLRQVKSCLAILAVGDGKRFAEVAVVLRIHEQPVATWVRGCGGDGLNGAPRHTPPGRPPKRTPTQQAALATLLDEGPIPAGFRSAGWRSPMMQPLRGDRFGVFDHVFSMAQLLKNLGLSYPKAAFVSAHLDERKRYAWCTTTWPLIWRLAQERQALLLCGAEASFPPWGTLSSTWARRGHQPMVTTAGQRKGDKVFGVIEYCTGRFWSQGQAGRLHAEAYSALLTRVLAQVTQPIMLMHEGARYHPAVAMPRFLAVHRERVLVFPLPSDSPDDNPIDKRWKKVNKEGTHWQSFPTFQALTDTVEPALLKFANTPKEMLSWCSLPTELAQAA